MQPARIDFPIIETTYVGEFGRIEPEICAIARQLWHSYGESFAEDVLRDRALGMQLMLKAAANVSTVISANPEKVRSNRAYLYRTFKNLVLGHLEKENGRQQLLDRRWPAEDLVLPEPELNQRILVNEIRRRMNDWTRSVFDLHQLGYTFEEIASSLGTSSNIVRSRYSKEVARLAKSINAGIREYIVVQDKF